MGGHCADSHSISRVGGHNTKVKYIEKGRGKGGEGCGLKVAEHKMKAVTRKIFVAGE